MPDKKKKTEHASVSKSKKSRKGLDARSASIIAAVVAVLLIIIGLIYYVMVRQNPTNIVMDSVVTTLEAKNIQSSGDMHFAIDRLGASVDVHFSADKADQDGATDAKVTYQSDNVKKPVVVNAKAVLAQNGDLYLKLDNAKGVAATIFAEMDALRSRVQAQGSKTTVLSSSKILVEMGGFLNDKWIKFPVGANSAVANDTFTCIQSAVAKVNANSAERSKVIQAYKNHDFLVIDNTSLPKEGSSNGYRLSIDREKLAAFKKEAANTEAGKLLKSCVQNNSQMATSDEGVSGALDVWIDRNSHKITHIKTTDESSDVKLDMKLDVGAKTNVDVPKDAKTIEEIFTAPQQQAKKQ